MAKLTEELIMDLKRRHYIRKANSSTYWFGFDLNKINEFKKYYEDDFHLILYQSKNDFCYYAIPYIVFKSILKEDNLDSVPDRKRWSGHIRDNKLKIKNDVLDVENYYNIDFNVNSISTSNQIISPDITPIEAEASLLPEGAKKTISVNKYERNPEARKRCIDFYGTVCQICEFDFEKVYGGLGKGFIEVHHNKPVSEIGESYEVDPIKDMIPVCPNCHSMLHLKRNITISIDCLRDIIKEKKYV